MGSFAQQTPYAGQHTREIKALSPPDIESYLAGQGMGLAKAAELNHFPGPKHVLELADALNLSKEQLTQTQALFELYGKRPSNWVINLCRPSAISTLCVQPRR